MAITRRKRGRQHSSKPGLAGFYKRFVARNRYLRSKDPFAWDAGIGAITGIGSGISTVILAHRMKRPTIPKVALVLGGTTYLAHKGLRRILFGKKPPKTKITGPTFGGYLYGAASISPAYTSLLPKRPVKYIFPDNYLKLSRRGNLELIAHEVSPGRWEPI